MKKRVIIGVIISIIVVFFLLRSIDYTQTVTAIMSFGLISFVTGILIYSSSFVFRSLRWQLIVHPIKAISFTNSLYIIFISYFCNSVLPARIGDLIRGSLLTLTEDINFFTSISTVIFDRTLDGVTLALLFCFSLLISGNDLKFDPNLNFFILLIIVLFFTLLIIYILDLSVILKMLSPLQKISPKYSKILIDSILNFHSGGEILKLGKIAIFKLFIFSIFVWICEASLFYFVLYKIGIVIPISVLFILLAVVNFVIMIPSAPGYIGTFETAFVLVLVLYGANNSLALSGALIIHIIWFFTTIVFGLISMKCLGVSMHQLIDKLKNVQEEK
jgi:glycosyltransferase 2 family protein